MREDFHLQQICINTTNQCNNRCVYCFTDHNVKNMTLDTAKAAIKFLIDNQPEKNINIPDLGGSHRVFVNWFGGEPMLRYEEVIKPAMLWAEEQGYDIGWGISTNGELLTPASLKFFAHFNTGILFSIDGDKDIQDEQRPLANGGSSWEILKDKIKMFGEYGRNSIFRATFLAKNIDKLSDTYMLARSNGFQNFFPGPVYEDPEWSQEKYDIFLEKAFEICSVMYKDYCENGYCTIVQPVFGAIREFLLPEKINYSERRCGLGTNTAGISPEGLIFGCQEHSTLEGENDIFWIGDVFNGIDIEKRNRLLDEYKKGCEEYENNEKCKNCRFKEGCFISNCPSVTLRAAGSFGSIVDSFCAWKDIWDKCGLFLLAAAQIDKNEKFIKLVMQECFDSDYEEEEEL